MHESVFAEEIMCAHLLLSSTSGDCAMIPCFTSSLHSLFCSCLVTSVVSSRMAPSGVEGERELSRSKGKRGSREGNGGMNFNLFLR